MKILPISASVQLSLGDYRMVVPRRRIHAVGISIGDQVVVDGINYRWVVKGFKGKLLVLEKKGQFNEQQPRTILRTARQVTKI
jgi:hypothetical protein